MRCFFSFPHATFSQVVISNARCTVAFFHWEAEIGVVWREKWVPGYAKRDNLLSYWIKVSKLPKWIQALKSCNLASKVLATLEKKGLVQELEGGLELARGERWQVCTEGELLGWKWTISGVPQKLVLGAIWINIFISDLGTRININGIHWWHMVRRHYSCNGRLEYQTWSWMTLKAGQVEIGGSSAVQNAKLQTWGTNNKTFCYKLKAY